MKVRNEQLPDEPKRRLLKLGGAFLLGSSLRLVYTSHTAQAQSEETAPEGEFSFASAFTNPNPNEVFEPYPGRPWTRSVANVTDSDGRTARWEKISVITPEKPFRFIHDPNIGSWSMQSLLGGQPLEARGDAVVLAELELDTPPTAINTGLIVHNGEVVKDGNHRRIAVGAQGSDLFFAFWDGSPAGNYTVNMPSISQLEYDADKRLQLSLGIYLPKDGKNSKLLLPDGQTTPAIPLNGSSFNNPGLRKIDVAVSTTPEVTNTIKKLMILHKLSEPNIPA